MFARLCISLSLCLRALTTQFTNPSGNARCKFAIGEMVEYPTPSDKCGHTHTHMIKLEASACKQSKNAKIPLVKQRKITIRRWLQWLLTSMVKETVLQTHLFTQLEEPLYLWDKSQKIHCIQKSATHLEMLVLWTFNIQTFYAQITQFGFKTTSC